MRGGPVKATDASTSREARDGAFGSGTEHHRGGHEAVGVECSDRFDEVVAEDRIPTRHDPIELGDEPVREGL